MDERPRAASAIPILSVTRLGLAFTLALGCSTPTPDPHYRSAENVLEVIALLRVHVSDDTYRFAPARDYTGRNIYRSSLLRLESLESIHADALRAGHMNGVLAFAKARALERLRAFDLAAEEYRIAARFDSTLEAEALSSADVCSSLQRATRMAIDLDALTGTEPLAELRASETALESMIVKFEERSRLLGELSLTAEGTHYAAVVAEEIERTDVTRAAYITALRHVIPEGNVRAVAALRRVVVLHPDSKYANRHMMSLANLYAIIATEYVRGYPSETLRFDVTRFRELTDAATRLYESVASRDGTPEKLEAARRLEAFLAFALTVDRDRFTP